MLYRHTTIIQNAHQQLNKQYKMGQYLMLVCVLVVTISATPNAVHVAPVAVIDTVDYPRYAFNYAVRDPITRDNKAQWETRDGDVVKGSYSIADPNGSLRVVDYRADDHTGFNAVVKKLGPSVHDTSLVNPFLNPIVVATVPMKPIKPLVTGIHPIPLLAKTVPKLIPLVGPLSYGFGGAPINANIPHNPSRGRWSLPWDPTTHSYGGWRPLSGHLPLHDQNPYVNIYRNEYMDDGKLHKWDLGLIPFGKTLTIKKIH